MELTWQICLIVCPLVFLAGFVDSVAGGGGLISLPAYYLTGMDPVLAAGTNKLSAGLGTLASTGRFLAGKKINWRVALLAALAAFPGSWLGTYLMRSIPKDAVRVLMIVVIPLVAAVVLRRRTLSPRALAPVRWHGAVSAAIGLVVGFYDGFVGPGTGTFLIILFTSLLGMETVMASGTAKVVNLTSNLSAFISQLLAGKVIIGLGLLAGVCGVAGNWLGAGMTMRRGTGFIRIMLLVVLGLLLAKMVIDVL